jgi:CheY-like chemotaxis protein
MGATSLLRLRMETGESFKPGDMSRELEIIERATHRAASSVKRLLTLTRKRTPESAVFRLDETLTRVVEFAERSVDQSVRIEKRSGLPEAYVSGDAGQVEQLILNLVINAEHAMTTMWPEGHNRGGTVSVGIQPFRPGRTFLSANPEAEDQEYWALSVLDEGVGIPRHIQNRIFDPFYTTKPHDSSSGLGLAMVQAIARQHGGLVELRSEPGAGAEFTVYLPRALAETSTATDTAPTHRGEGLVLVADDDDLPLETAVVMLEALGYKTATASGGVEALRLFDERRTEWRAAVLDLRLGDMSGDAVAVRMRQSRPGLPVVLASGLHDEAADLSFLIETSFSLLRKPYTVTEFGGALEAAIGLN